MSKEIRSVVKGVAPGAEPASAVRQREARERLERPAPEAGAGELAGADRARLVHELGVHQIELEMQNEQLRQAQTALEGSRDRYADLFQRAPVGFVVLGKGDRIVEVNRLAAEMLARPAPGLLGLRLLDFIFLEDREHFLRHLGQLMQLDDPQTVEVRLGVRGAELRWVSLQMVRVLGEGRVMQCRAALIDIDERVRMQRDTARLAAIVAGSADAIVSRDFSGRVTTWNDGAARMFGTAADDICGRTMDHLVPPWRRDEEQSLLLRMRRGERIDQLETERLGERGALLPLSITLSPIRDAKGQIVGSAMIARDISERHRALNALRVRLRQLDALSHSGQALIMGKEDPLPLQQELFERVAEAVDSEVQLNYAMPDEGGALVLVSARGLPADLREQMRSAGPDDSLCGMVAGQHHHLVINHLQDSTLPQAAALQRAGARCFAGFPLVARGQVYGVAAFASTSVEHFREGDLQVMQTVCDQAAAMHERTRLLDELHLREQSLQRADRAKDEFIATLAHELRNPLAPIRNAVGIMRREEQGISQRLAWCRDIIDRQVNQMTHLLEDLLDVSRVTRSKVELRRAHIDLAAVLEQALEATRPLIDAQGQRLVVDLPREAVMLYADLTRLTQVFANLLNNAAKYTDSNGLITVDVRLQGDFARIGVRDSGIGIEPQQLPHLFDMFSQLAPALGRARGGLGIGLALTRGLVDLHGGTIEAFSAGAGQGSEFVVRLPIASPARAKAPEVKTFDTPSQPGCRVLVVDDNVDAAQTLAAILGLSGHEVRVAYTGAEGLDIAQKWKPDVGVLDIGIPDLSGYELSRSIRESNLDHQPVLIACTGWGQQEDIERAHRSGFDHHLVKPVEPDAVLRLLPQGLGASGGAGAG